MPDRGPLPFRFSRSSSRSSTNPDPQGGSGPTAAPSATSWAQDDEWAVEPGPERWSVAPAADWSTAGWAEDDAEPSAAAALVQPAPETDSRPAQVPAVRRDPEPPVMAEPRAPLPGRRSLSHRSRIAAGIGALVVVQALFTLSALGALHDPRPRGVTLGVAAPDDATARQVVRNLDALSRGGVDAHVVALAQARARVRSGGDDAALTFGVTGDVLYVASAAGPLQAQQLAGELSGLDASLDRSLTTVDVAPLPAADPSGIAPFYLATGWVLAGYLGVIALARIGAGARTGRRLVAVRLGRLLGYAVGTALLTSLLTDWTLGIGGGHWFGMTLAGTGVVVTTGCAAGGLRTLFGLPGTLVIPLLVLGLGAPASGGLVPRHLTGGLWQDTGGLLPNGAGTDLLRRALYFGHDGIGGPVLVLLAWGLAGLALAAVASQLARTPAHDPDETPYAASLAAA